MALPLWIEGGFKDRIVLHVDAHDDLWPDPGPEKVETTRSLARLGDVAEIRRRSVFFAPRDTKIFGINNFLVMAHRLGVVSKVYWAYPGFDPSNREAMERIRTRILDRNRLTGRNASDNLAVTPPYIRGTLSGVPVEIGALGNFPHGNETGVLLDIDLDYFPDLYRNPVKDSWRGLLSGFAEHVDAALLRRTSAVLIAYSQNGGYLPVTLRFLGPWLRDLLSNPAALRKPPPANWVRKDEALYQEHFQQFEEAIPIYREMLETDPENPDTHLSLALCLLSGDTVDEAMEHLRMSVALDNQYIAGYLEAAAILARRGQPGAALDVLAAAERSHPQSGMILDALGNLRHNQGRYTDAISHYLRVLSAGQGSALTHAYLGDSYRLSGQPEKAEEHYLEAIAWNADFPDSLLPAAYWRLLGKIQESLRKPREAARSYRAFLERPDAGSPAELQDVKDRIRALSAAD